MQIYIADLHAYNSGYLKGEWMQLPTENEDIKEAIQRQSQNGQNDYAIHDWELPFKIGEYTDPLKINELCHTIQELDLNEYIIKHLEYAYGIDIKNTDTYTLAGYIDDIYTIEANNDIEFAENYMYEYYYDQIESLPWELSYSIDYETVYNKLEITMSITKDEEMISAVYDYLASTEMYEVSKAKPRKIKDNYLLEIEINEHTKELLHNLKNTEQLKLYQRTHTWEQIYKIS